MEWRPKEWRPWQFFNKAPQQVVMDLAVANIGLQCTSMQSKDIIYIPAGSVVVVQANTFVLSVQAMFLTQTNVAKKSLSSLTKLAAGVTLSGEGKAELKTMFDALEAMGSDPNALTAEALVEKKTVEEKAAKGALHGEEPIAEEPKAAEEASEEPTNFAAEPEEPKAAEEPKASEGTEASGVDVVGDNLSRLEKAAAASETAAAEETVAAENTEAVELQANADSAEGPKAEERAKAKAAKAEPKAAEEPKAKEPKAVVAAASSKAAARPALVLPRGPAPTRPAILLRGAHGPLRPSGNLVLPAGGKGGNVVNKGGKGGKGGKGKW